MSIRTATEADLDDICTLADEIALLHNSHEPDVFAEPDATRDREFWRASITQPDATVIVATDADAILGFITAKMSRAGAPTFVRPRAICRIGTLVVASHALRRGIGTQLIREIEAWARTESAVETRLEVFAFNRRALGFYASLGYAIQSHNLSKIASP